MGIPSVTPISPIFQSILWNGYSALLMDTAKSLARSSLNFFSGTLISRVTGMLRDVLMAFCFGADPAVAAFLVAFRFSNLARRIFGEGALTVSFIPYFESFQKESPRRAALFFRDLISLLSLVLLVFVLLICLLLYSLNFYVQEENRQILWLTGLMMPGLFFICLFGVFSAVLHSAKMYFLPSWAPALFNGVWILTIWLERDLTPIKAMEGLAIAVTAAFMVQFSSLVPTVSHIFRSTLTLRDWLKPELFSRDLWALFASLSMGLIGVGAVQFNTACDALFARAAALEGPAYLNYAIRLEQLPLALFAIGIAAAALPPLSRAVVQGNWQDYRQLLQFALVRTFSLVFPCTIAILITGGAAVNLLYGRGHFTSEAVYQTATCLFAYGIGLVPSAFIILMASAFYARKEYRIPTLASLLAIGVNLALNAFFVWGLKGGASSIAFATSLGAFINLGTLYWFLSSRVENLYSKEVKTAFVKIGVCTLFAGVATGVVDLFLFSSPLRDFLFYGGGNHAYPTDFSAQCFHFFSLAGVFGLVLLCSAYLEGLHKWKW